VNPATLRNSRVGHRGTAPSAPRYWGAVAAILALTVFLLPEAVLAQHGGGGHTGGGGHVSGSGSSGGSFHGVAHSSGHGTVGSSMTVGRGVASARIGGRGFSTGSSRWMGPGAGRGIPIRRMATSHLVTSPVLNPGLRSLSVGERGPFLGMLATPFPRRAHGNGFFFFGGGCFDGFFPGFCSFAPGFFGFPFFESFGWDNDGAPPFESFGYPYAPSMSDEIEGRIENQPQYYEAAPFSYEYQYPPEGPKNSESAEPEGKLLLLYLKDGSMYALTNYWVAGGKLHYVTSYGGENAIEMDLVDVQHTVDVNSKRGVTFVLTPRVPAGADRDNSQRPKSPQP
jgi:hypothetical protein